MIPRRERPAGDHAVQAWKIAFYLQSLFSIDVEGIFPMELALLSRHGNS
jgi:hypothetical protein